MTRWIEQARQVADAASKGPWSYDAGEVVADGYYDVSEGRTWYVVEIHDNGESGVQSDNDGRFIETFDPPTVKALLDVAEAAINVVDWLPEHGRYDEELTDAVRRLQERLQGR